MKEDKATKYRNMTKASLAVFCFVAFSITLPPLGFLFFLEGSGIVSSKSMDDFVAWITTFQDALTVFLIVAVGFLSLFMMFTSNRTAFRITAFVLIFLAVTSVGGCLMGLSNLSSIGS